MTKTDYAAALSLMQKESGDAEEGEGWAEGETSSMKDEGQVMQLIPSFAGSEHGGEGANIDLGLFKP